MAKDRRERRKTSKQIRSAIALIQKKKARYNKLSDQLIVLYQDLQTELEKPFLDEWTIEKLMKKINYKTKELTK